MIQQISINLTQDAINNLDSFVESAIGERKEYLANWARGDGYTDEDFKAAEESIKAAQQLVSQMKEALASATNDEAATPVKVDHDGTDSREAYTPAMIAEGWVIYSAREAATMDGAGFWNTGHGWCQEGDANMHPAEYVGHYALPSSLGQDRHWINLPLAKRTTEAALCNALAVFCESQNLPQESADDLLILRDLKPFQLQWLKQFIRQWERATGK